MSRTLRVFTALLIVLGPVAPAFADTPSAGLSTPVVGWTDTWGLDGSRPASPARRVVSPQAPGAAGPRPLAGGLPLMVGISRMDARSWNGHGLCVDVWGVVKNGGKVPVTDVTVRVRQRSSSGAVLRDYLLDPMAVSPPAMGGDHITPFVMYPGDYAAFNTEKMCPLHAQTAFVEVTASGTWDARMPLPVDTEVVGRIQHDTTLRTYTVRLTNPTAEPLTRCRVSILEYDEDTGSIWTLVTHDIPGGDIPPPGESRDVVLQVNRDIGYADSWDVWAEGTKAAPVTTTVSRLAGATRYETAIRASEDAFPAGAATAVVVSGQGFADALSASALAGAYDGPILLTPTTYVHRGLLDEVRRLGASKVVIVGGERVVPGTVAGALLGALPPGGSVERIAGGDRYATSARVCSEVASVAGTPPQGAFVVRGDAFPDALAASPHAFSRVMPILLVRPGQAPPAVVAAASAAGVGELWVVGGTGAVADATADSFGVSWTRVFGASRWETAGEMALLAHDEGWSDLRVVGLTTGRKYPDALVAGPSVGRAGGVLLLTDPALLSREAGWVVMLTADHMRELRVFGGTGAVSMLAEGTAWQLGY